MDNSSLVVGKAAGLLALATSFFTLTGCGAAPEESPEGESASVELELAAAPADAVCHKATFTSATQSFEKAFDVAAANSAPVTLAALPSGTFSLAVTAFPQSCATVPAGAAATWAAAPISVTLAPGTITGATVFLRRAATTTVVIDYDTSSVVYTAPAGSTIRGIAAQGSSLFVADTTQIVRQPEMGGGATQVATATGVSAIGADANNLVWAVTSPSPSMWRLPTAGFGVPKLLLNTGASMISVVNGIAVTLDISTVRAVPVTLASPNLVTPVFGPSGYTTIATDSTNAYFADGGRIYKQVLTSPGGVPGNLLATEPALSIAADGTTVFYTTPETLKKVPVAGGAVTPMLSFFPTPIALVVVDASNVYFLTTALSTSPAKCIGATLNRVAKNGTTATPVWSRPGVCPDRLTQTTTGLFLADTTANWVLRVPK